jgi:hypothetical protein
MCALGLPGWLYATSADPDERVLLTAMLGAALDERRRQTRELVDELLVGLGLAKRT